MIACLVSGSIRLDQSTSSARAYGATECGRDFQHSCTSVSKPRACKWPTSDQKDRLLSPFSFKWSFRTPALNSNFLGVIILTLYSQNHLFNLISVWVIGTINI